MAEYINREKARELIKNFGKGAVEDGQNALDPVDDINLLAKGVDLIPAADVVEVVRCKECGMSRETEDEEYRFCIQFRDTVHTQAFCSYGERKGDCNNCNNHSNERKGGGE